MRTLLLLVACTGCSTLLGIDDLSGPGDDVQMDGPPPPPPGAIRIQGTTRLATGPGGMNQTIGDGMIEARGNQSDLPLGSAFVASDGTFELFVDATTTGGIFDGHLVSTPSAESGGVLISHVYLARPASGDVVGLEVLHIDTTALDALRSFCQVQMGIPNAPFYAIIALGPNDLPAEGAKIETTPLGSYCSSGGGGIPTPGNITGPDGTVFAFDVQPGFTSILSDFGTRDVQGVPGVMMYVPVAPSN